MDSTNLSSIDKASFLAGLQINYGKTIESEYLCHVLLYIFCS